MQRNFTLSKKLISKIEKGDHRELVENLISFGQRIGVDVRITSVKGPYFLESEKDGSDELYIVNYDSPKPIYK